MKKLLIVFGLSTFLCSCGGGSKSNTEYNSLSTPHILLKKADPNDQDKKIEFIISNFNDYITKNKFPLIVSINDKNNKIITQKSINKESKSLTIKNLQNTDFYIKIISKNGEKSRASNIIKYNKLSCDLTQAYISVNRSEFNLENNRLKVILNNIIDNKKNNDIFNLYLSMATANRTRYLLGDSLTNNRVPYISGLTGYDINRLDEKITELEFSESSDKGKYIISSSIEDNNSKKIIANKNIEIYFSTSTTTNRNLNFKSRGYNADISDPELEDLATSLKVGGIFLTATKSFDFMLNFNEGAEALVYYKELKLHPEYNAQKREHLFGVFVLGKILENSVLYSKLKLSHLVENVIKLMENHLNEISSVGSFGAGQEQTLQFSHEEFSLFSASERSLDVYIRAVLYFPSGEFPNTRYYPQRAKFEKEFSVSSTSSKKVLFPYPGIYDVYAKDIDGTTRKKRITIRRIGQKIDVSFNYNSPTNTKYKIVFGEKITGGCLTITGEETEIGEITL